MMELQQSRDREVRVPSQSIFGAMKEFIDAVDDMDKTVLIPSRLLDMQVDLPIALDGQNGNIDTKLPALPSDSSRVTLHSYYAILKAVRTELIGGTSNENGTEKYMALNFDINMGNEELGDDNLKLQVATARVFRDHLMGLFSVLEQMTEMSQQLTNKYRSELGDHQSCLKPKTFSV